MAISTRNITHEAMERTQDDKSVVMQNTSFDKKNYLNVKLENGEVEKKIIIRLLTVSKDTDEPFQHIHMHTVGVPNEVAESGYKSYICLSKTRGKYTEALGTKCPFCEERARAYNEFVAAKERGDMKAADQWKKKSISLIPNEVSIIRCIERGKENEGVKFWKFNLRSDKLDPENQIRELYRNKKEECEMENKPIENILDLNDGYDIKVTIKRVFDKENKPTNKTTISLSLFGSKKPVSENPEQIEAWENDEKVWSDVFVAKPYDYGSVIIEGGIPWFNRDENKWVKKIDIETYRQMKKNEQENAEQGINREIAEAEKQATVQKPVNNAPSISFDDEELPF